MTVLTRCECCDEIRDDVYSVKRYGEQTAVDDYRVVGYFNLCTDCEEKCPPGIGWCARGRCVECGIRLSWAECNIGKVCEPCAGVAWAFGWERKTSADYFLDVLSKSLNAISEKGAKIEGF